MGHVLPPDLEVFHYGEGRIRRVRSALIKDGMRCPGEPDFSQPALPFHGVHDETVPMEGSPGFAAAHADVGLVELESGQELLDVPDEIVSEAVPFLMRQPVH
jgi:hypothetical protein